MYGSIPLPFVMTLIYFRFISSPFEMQIPPLSLATDWTSSVMMSFTIMMNYLRTTRNLWTNCMKSNESSIHIFVASLPPCLMLHLISEMPIWNIFQTTQLLLIESTTRWRIIPLSRTLLMSVVNFFVD